MAYNAISGTLIAAQNYVPASGSIVANVVSGNLSTSDGASIINVPRVSNATNNSILTNVGGDANTLTCESNLTFDGSTLNITGHLTASIGLSASFLYGDGRYLTNVTGSGGNASGQGPSGSVQFHTSNGTISGSADLVFRNDVLRVGGGIKLERRSINDDYTITTLDYFVGTDTNPGAVQLTLPSAASVMSGQTFVVKDEGGAGASNHITIAASGGDTIDGANSVVLKSPYASVQLYCNGANKYFIY